MSLAKLLLNRAAEQKVIGVVAGTGECARAAVGAGADLLLALSAGVYRSLGRPSMAALLPFGDTNALTRQLLRDHLLPHAAGTPVMAGLFGRAGDEGLDGYLDDLKAWGVPAVTHWPSVGQVDGDFRAALEGDGQSVAAELDTLLAVQARGFEIFPFVFTPEDAARCVSSGVDGVVLVAGVTQSVDDIRAKRDRLQRAITRLNAMREAAAGTGRRVPCIAYGGPITEPEDLELLFRFCPVDGFAGGSVFERLPLRDITATTVRRFKGIAHAAAAGGEQPGERGLGALIGCSPAMTELFTRIRRVAPYDVSVLVQGETGSGKELVASQIHRLSARAHQDFVTLNCGALPETLLESELFGHERGAFTGAERRRLGKFELAHRGTLFLDEVASLSPHGQVALLRALQQREITRLGGEQPIPVDVRIVAASNEDLAACVAQGRFRADLLHRLNQVTLHAPPLRERGDDLQLLAEEFLKRHAVELDKKLLGVSPRFRQKLEAHAWPGNVRELQHVLLHAALMEDGPVLEGVHFQPQRAWQSPGGAAGALAAHRGEAWRAAVVSALEDARGNKTRAAAALGVTRKTLYAWMRECGL